MATNYNIPELEKQTNINYIHVFYHFMKVSPPTPLLPLKFLALCISYLFEKVTHLFPGSCTSL